MVNIQFEEQEVLRLINILDSVKKTDITDKLKRSLGLPVALSEDKSFENVAKLIMKEVLYDNDMINRFKPEYGQYPDKWVGMIEEACEKFFTANPERLDEKIIEAIALDPEEISLSTLEGGEELNKVLNHWFDHYSEEDELQGEWVEDYISSEPISRCTKCGKVVHKGQKKFCECDKIVKE